MTKPKKSNKESVTFRIAPHKKKALDEVAEALDQDRSTVLDEAVTFYLDHYKWQIEKIKRGLEDIKAGRVTPHEEVTAYWKAKREDYMGQ